MQGSIIVYRNPLEQMFWEGSGGFPNFVSIIAGVVTFFILFSIITDLLEKQLPWKYRRIGTYASLGSSATIGILVAHYLWL